MDTANNVADALRGHLILSLSANLDLCDLGGSIYGSESSLIDLCRGLGVHKLLGCFTVVNLTLINSRKTGSDELEAVIRSRSSLAEKHGSSNDTTTCERIDVTFLLCTRKMKGNMYSSICYLIMFKSQVPSLSVINL
jgi:hypothetical protein